ncbi:hypothetical protein [Candidatus Stoquefichus massiliensis]|uniref:hypothetical protein n=1 Tax=Candidatus Stoquefichus massiliensis TaxID=1470350 RepID=UPI0004805486|nr:hypothetical protein [Candidatus Stoquefichus massiliensis]
MQNLLIGNVKNGWEIDDEKKELKIYCPISFFEKMKKVEPYKCIPFSNIKQINVGWNSVPLAMGENQHFVLFKLILINNEIIDFEGTKNDVSKELFKKAILLLKDNQINFNDPYNVLEKIINTEENIWNILHEAELKRRSYEKNKKKR